LLGLIGGTGETDFSSSSVDFLVGQGLVEELDQLMNRQTLVKNRGIGRGGSGQGTGTGGGTGDGDDLDDLVAFGASGGIDDLLEDVGGMSTVDMTKKGDIAIEKPRQLRGSPTARGHRTVESVMNIILNQKGMMDYTYTKYLRTEPDLRGKISLDVTIEANGRVSDVTIVESTFPSQDFINDIIRIIRRLRFPTIPEGSITVNLPLVFNRVG
jgi:TonB family protein